MDETLMAFLGASGMSVKIVCRGELFGTSSDPSEGEEKLPLKEQDMRQFHKNLYETARRAYQNQFGLDIEYLEPQLERTVYLSADPEMYFLRCTSTLMHAPSRLIVSNIRSQSRPEFPGRVTS